MKAILPSETLVNDYETKRYHIKGGNTLFDFLVRVTNVIIYTSLKKKMLKKSLVIKIKQFKALHKMHQDM
jgi:hypothetical protein